jgi:hypothetical protein
VTTALLAAGCAAVAALVVLTVVVLRLARLTLRCVRPLLRSAVPCIALAFYATLRMCDRAPLARLIRRRCERYWFHCHSLMSMQPNVEG